ncbi:MAG: hypothetical protein KIT54_11125 [Phycisphaeraceae bacterium]|nr:hypothetical protein [Phycisphaeraceae bacterium]
MPSDAPACAGVLQTGARRWFCFVLATCVLVGWPAGVLGQGGELTREKLLAWFEAERAKAIDPPPLGNVRLDYEVREHAYATPALLAQWKREVEGRPEHPKRQLIPVVERRLRDGPDVAIGSIWRPGADAWRQNLEPSRPTPGVVAFGDIGQRGDQHWRLFEDTVVLEKPGSPSVIGEIAGLKNVMALFLHGGLHRGRSGKINSLEITGTSWTIEAANDNGWSWTYEGWWDSELERGFVRRVEERPAARDSSARVWDFGPYEVDPVLSRWVATRVDYRTGEGPEQSRMEHVLVGVHEVDKSHMAALLRVPAVGKNDAIRGVIASGFEQDVGQGVVRRIDEAGRVAETNRIAPPPPSSPVLRIVGIVAAVAIVVVLIWMRVRR